MVPKKPLCIILYTSLLKSLIYRKLVITRIIKLTYYIMHIYVHLIDVINHRQSVQKTRLYDNKTAQNF